MRKIIAGILCTLLAASCLCGCEKKDSDTGGGKERLYLLTECVEYDDDGQVLRRSTYDYDDRGLITSYELDRPEMNEVWNEYFEVFEVVQEPCDGVVDDSLYCSYDKNGNPTSVDDSQYGVDCYEYTYDARGRVKTFERSTTDGLLSTNYELEYDEDGTITLCYIASSGEKRETQVFETTGSSGDCISKIVRHDMEATYTVFLEYDDGNLTNIRETSPSGTVRYEADCSYDRQGRVISEQGFGRSSDGEIVYQYEDDRLVAINDEALEYTEGEDGEMSVRYKNYELTYEPIKLSEEEADLARHRWNQFCGGFGTAHSYWRGLDGIRYPVFDLNTGIFLLPKMIYG